MSRLIHTLLLASATMLILPDLATSQDEPELAKPRNCISTRTIRRTQIIDDRHILFYGTGSTVYLNILPRICNSLSREGRFSYQGTTNRLCDLDHINVLYQGGTNGLRTGNSCKLGLFTPVSREDAKALLESDPLTEEPATVGLPEPEEIGDDDASPEN